MILVYSATWAPENVVHSDLFGFQIVVVFHYFIPEFDPEISSGKIPSPY
jgi:hypothetical protein